MNEKNIMLTMAEETEEFLNDEPPNDTEPSIEDAYTDLVYHLDFNETNIDVALKRNARRLQDACELASKAVAEVAELKSQIETITAQKQIDLRAKMEAAGAKVTTMADIIKDDIRTDADILELQAGLRHLEFEKQNYMDLARNYSVQHDNLKTFSNLLVSGFLAY